MIRKNDSGASVRRGEWAGDSGWEVAHLLTGGHAGQSGFDGTEADWKAAHKARREALRRKRPVGFAPWPVPTPKGKR